MSQAASIPTPIDYAPGGSFGFTVLWPESYAASTSKWFVFELRQHNNGPVLFRATDGGGYLSVSSHTLTVSIPKGATNEVTGGETFENCARMMDNQKANMQWRLDTGADADTTNPLYRVQGELRTLPSHGSFTPST
jgi:hypothetical protein